MFTTVASSQLPPPIVGSSIRIARPPLARARALTRPWCAAATAATIDNPIPAPPSAAAYMDTADGSTAGFTIRSVEAMVPNGDAFLAEVE